MPKISKKKSLGRGLSSLLGENLNVDNLMNANLKNNIIIIFIDLFLQGFYQNYQKKIVN